MLFVDSLYSYQIVIYVEEKKKRIHARLKCSSSCARRPKEKSSLYPRNLRIRPHPYLARTPVLATVYHEGTKGTAQ